MASKNVYCDPPPSLKIVLISTTCEAVERISPTAENDFANCPLYAAPKSMPE
jgi:hypothetical protein